MNAKELKQALQTGPLTVEFGLRIEDLEDYPERGMRAELLEVRLQPDATALLRVNYAPFDAHNRTLESANYFDKEGRPTLTARQAGYYKVEDDLCVMASEDLSPDTLVVLPDRNQELINAFRCSGEPSYIRWLEAQLLEVRANAVEASPGITAVNPSA